MPQKLMAADYISREVNVADKAVIIKEGGKNLSVFLILEGRVKVKKKTPQGSVVLETLSQGAVFGESPWLGFTGTVEPATVVADGPVRLGLIDPQVLTDDYQRVSPQLKGVIQALLRQFEQCLDELSRRAAGG
jgi:CRP-like cAMP-binding protein